MMALKNVTDEVREYWERMIRISKGTLDFNFRTWFIGFIEGFDNKAFVRDGYKSVHFEFTLPLRELKVVNYINENFKPLNLQTFIILTKKRVTFKVTDRDSLLKIICIFSGSIFIREYFGVFRFWVAVFRYIYDIHIVFFTKTIQNLPMYRWMWLTQTGWLSGLLDARCLFTKITYYKSFNILISSQLEGQLILPMKIAREIKLFEELARIYGGKLKMIDKKSKKIYYCLDFADIRLLSFLLKKYPLMTEKSKFFRSGLDIVNVCGDLICDKRTIGLLDSDQEKKEREVSKLIHKFNAEIDETKFYFGGYLREIWETMFEKRAEKREKSSVGQYANFLEKKYEYVLNLKPKSFSIILSKPSIIFYLSLVLNPFQVFAFLRRGHFKLRNSYEVFHSIFIVDLDKTWRIPSFFKSVSFLVDLDRCISQKRILDGYRYETFYEAHLEFLKTIRDYHTVVDCELI